MHRQRGHSPRVRNTKVVCGTGYLEGALDEGLHAIELELPNGILTIDREKSEINIIRSLALSEKGPLVFYNRLYPPQHGTKELVTTVDRTLERAYKDLLDEHSLSRQFEKYLVDNLDFTEKAAFRSDASSEAEIQGKVSFSTHKESVIPKANIECSICLSEGFIEEISEVYRKDSGQDLTARRRKILAKKQGLLRVDAFLRALDIPLASGRYESTKIYRNLKKCSLFLTGIAFKDAVHPYSITLGGLHGSRDEK